MGIGIPQQLIAALAQQQSQQPQQSQGGGREISLADQFLAFLAGAGLDKVVNTIRKLIEPPGQGANRERRGGVRLESTDEGLTLAPQLIQQLLASRMNLGGPMEAPSGLQALLGRLQAQASPDQLQRSAQLQAIFNAGGGSV